MTRLVLRQYKADDFLRLELSPVAVSCRIGQPIQNWGKYHEAAGPAVTAENTEGEIVFCCGVHFRWGGLGELWATYSPIAARYPLVLRYTRGLIGVLFREHGYRRLQAAVDPRFEAAVRFIEHLGFEREGLMHSYSPNGDDYALYALVDGGTHG